MKAETYWVPFDIWVPGPLRNPMNGPHGHWSKHARWAREWRERAGMAILGLGTWKPRALRATDPKRVVFMLRTHNRVDDDALGPMVKPCRDALVDMKIIHSDASDSGHIFEYAQRIERKSRGVHIHVEPRGEA